MSLADLRPGDLGFGPIKGAAGLLVNAGQVLLGEGFRVGSLDIRHVFVVTHQGFYDGPNHDTFTGDSTEAVEAMPNGARKVRIDDRWTSEYAYVRLPEDYPGQASDAAAIARAMIGTPYSFASYAALAAWRFGLSTPRLEKWIGRRRPANEGPMIPTVPTYDLGLKDSGKRVALPAEAICSVLADQAWSLAGKKVFTDKRPHQCVTPGALAGRLLRMRDAEWMYGGE
jgi:hypothetical protein